jgi:disulfide bond formation protein DsbB
LSTDSVSSFLALLAVVAQLATLAALGLAVGGRFSAALQALGRRAVEAVGPSALAIAAAVAAVAMAGSLYYSEVAHFPPCQLCWYQRIAMYPLVPLLGIAAFRRDPGVALYGAVIAALGAPISIYHILVERGIVEESGSCDPNNPCSLIWVKKFGYLTIPTMALSGFLLIVTLLVVSRAGNRSVSGGPPRTPGEPSDRLSRSEVHGH